MQSLIFKDAFILSSAALRRTGSKGSLYASRSSLYSRRRRKNSGGESVYSYAQDDMDFDDRDRDSFKQRGLSRRNRSARSLGDLEVELRDQATRSTQTLRECATQTGAGFANVSPGKKTVVKKTKPRSVSSSQTQTVKSKPRNLDSSSSSSGIARPRERKNSASSASGRSRSKERKKSERPKRNKSETSLKDFADAAEESSRSGTPRDKPKPKARKRTTGSTGQLSDDDLESVRTGMTGPVDQSSVVGGGHVNPAMLGQPAMYPPQGYPGYQMGYPGQMAYMHATGQPPVMSFPPSVPAQPGAGAPNHMSTPAPGIAPKPQVSKWDMLCRMTGGDAAQGGDAYETGSVAGSVLSNPYSIQQFPPGYSSAMSDYAGSERSGPTRSMAGRSRSSRAQGRSAWDTLREMTDQEYEGSQYAPSVSNVWPAVSSEMTPCLHVQATPLLLQMAYTAELLQYFLAVRQQNICCSPAHSRELSELWLDRPRGLWVLQQSRGSTSHCCLHRKDWGFHLTNEKMKKKCVEWSNIIGVNIGENAPFLSLSASYCSQYSHKFATLLWLPIKRETECAQMKKAKKLSNTTLLTKII